MDIQPLTSHHWMLTRISLHSLILKVRLYNWLLTYEEHPTMRGTLLWGALCYEGHPAMRGTLLWEEPCYEGHPAMRDRHTLAMSLLWGAPVYPVIRQLNPGTLLWEEHLLRGAPCYEGHPMRGTLLWGGEPCYEASLFTQGISPSSILSKLHSNDLRYQANGRANEGRNLWKGQLPSLLMDSSWRQLLFTRYWVGVYMLEQC